MNQGAEPAGLGVDRPLRLAIAAAFAIVSGLGLLVLSVRFGIDTASITDDWVFAGMTETSLGDQLQAFVSATGRTEEEVYLGGRYRPAWELSQYVQWQTLGAPSDLTGPNLWAVARTFLFAAGIVVVPGIVAATGHHRPQPLQLAALGVGAGLLIFSGPITDIDFLRLGIQEPVLVGAPICGMALIAWGLARLFAPGREAGSIVLVYGTLVLGFALVATGLYFKEASICAVVMAPFLYLYLDRRWREAGLLDGPLWRRRSFQVVTVLLGMLLVGVAIGAQSVREAGFSLYGAEPPSGIGGYLQRAVDALQLEWETIGDQAQMSVWRWVAIAVSVLPVVVFVHRRRAPWLAIGFVATGWAILILQGFLLSPQTRFLIPAIALFAVAAILLLAELPPWLSYGAALAMAVLAVANFDNARDNMDSWVSREQDDNTRALELTADLHPESCPVHMFNLGIEQAESFPRLLPVVSSELSGACTQGYEGLLVGLKVPYPGPLGADAAARKACADSGGPTLIEQTPGYGGLASWLILGCKRFAVDLQAQETLRRTRIVPGAGISEAGAR